MTRTALHLAAPATALLWLLVIDGIQPAPSLHLAVVATALVTTLLAFWCTRIASGPAIALLLVAADVCLTRDITDDLMRSDPATTALALTSLAGLVVGALVTLSPLPGLLTNGRKRQRAESDLYGRARLLGGRDLAPLLRSRGLVLGETDRGRLISWPLEGSAITFAPPRTGKGATIALNLLSPDGRSHDGATLTIDPRGETWCIVARRRRQLGRRVILIDPFSVVAGHARNTAGTFLPHTAGLRHNPLDFIREDDSQAVRDIAVLLDGLMTPPGGNANASALHFHTSAREIMAGYIAWVRFRELPEKRTLARVRELLSQTGEERAAFIDRIATSPAFCGGLAHQAVARQSEVGKDEAGSQFSTIANQLAFLSFPELVRQTATSDFDPAVIASGDADIFVVVPDELLDAARPWLRLWITIPNALANRHAFARDLLVIIDEMPRLGFLKPVMDAYNLAAGKGVHFWCFAQSISALDQTWGEGARRTLIDLAEVVQILGFPRTDTRGADDLSKAIGTATFQAPSSSLSGSLDPTRLIPVTSRLQNSTNTSLVRERIVTPDQLMTMAPDEQYVVTAGKAAPRHALHLRHARYWQRRDTRHLADPNPFVIRKEKAHG